MPKYFFNIVVDGQPTIDGYGQDFVDDGTAREHAQHLIELMSDRCHDPINSFVAVSRPNGQLAFKVPFPEPGPWHL